MRKNQLCIIFLIILFVIFSPAENVGKEKSALSVNKIYANYLKEAQFDDFPVEVVNMAKYLILDSIGCALGGVQTDIGKSYLELAKGLGGGSESTIIGDGAKVSSLSAAYVNTQLANLLDYDDTYDLYLPGHPGCEIIQTALAMGEAVGSSGKDFLSAVILAYEVTLRAGRAAGSLLWQNPLDTSSGRLGVAAASSWLLKLDKEKIRLALQLAQMGRGSLPRPHKQDTPRTRTVSMIKGHYGLDAILGILAARQAQQGLTGREALLEGDLKNWCLAGGRAENFDILTQGLGKVYRILEVSFKPTPSCRWTHVPLTAAWKALGNKPIKSKEVSEIIIKGVNRLQRYEWDTMIEAQFSIPCSFALGIIGEEPGPGWYTTGRFKDADIRELAKKVKFENDPKAEELELKTGKMMCTVEIRFKDGTVKKASIDKIKGAPDNPMTDAEHRAKFRANAIYLIREARVKKVIDTIMKLENLQEISLLTKLLH